MRNILGLMSEEKTQKNSYKYSCMSCDFNTSNRNDYNRHCATRKHRILTDPNGNPNIPPSALRVRTVKTLTCICGKIYRHTSTLSAHKKKCSFTAADAPVVATTSATVDAAVAADPSITASMFMKVLDDNKDLRSMLFLQHEQNDRKQAELMEQMKVQQSHSDKKQSELMGQLKEQQKQMAVLIPRVGNNNTTNNNQRFNLQVFLNETCKDAINWEDFVRSIEVGTEEFDAMASSSMTEGVAKVICNGLQDLGVYKRPIHCVDMKRRKMCIKDSDTWNHDESDVDTLLHSANVSTKSKYNQVLCQWENEHPDWQQNEDETNTYLHLLGKVVESTDEKKCAIEVARNTVIPKD